MGDELPHVEGVEHRFVHANGVRLHVAEAGAPDAEPVVLLHGWPQHWWAWREVIGPLAEDYHVICPDLRGLGWSEAPASGYEKETLADDIVALLDELGVERVRFAGHDWGGWVGFLIALREPERLSSLLALSIVPPFSRVTPRSAAATWRFWYQWLLASPLGPRLLARPGAVGRAAVDWVGADAWSPEVREMFLGRLRDPARARASSLYYRTFQRELIALALGRFRTASLRVPTKVLFGTGDRAISHHLLEGCERHADQLEVELVGNAGHHIIDEKPDLVIARVRDLFAA